MKKKIGFFCLSVSLLWGESFVVEKPVVSTDKEKKYSEICDELWHEYEALLRAYSGLIRDAAQAQGQVLDLVRKLAKNTPKASRKKLLRDLESVRGQLKSIEDFAFL